MAKDFAPSVRLRAHALAAQNTSELRQDLRDAEAEQYWDMPVIFDLRAELELSEALEHEAFLDYTNPFRVDKTYHPPVG